jgi:YD repeat-containing protein
VLAFERTYNSVDYHPAKPGSPLGRSWFASYLQYLASDPDTANGLDAAYVHAVRPNGDVIRFNSTSPGSTSTQFQAVGEVKDRLVLALNGSGAFIGWRYITASDTEELYSSDGHLLTIRTRGGVTQTITYGTNGKVATVTDDFGHALTFQWEVSGLQRLTGVTLPGAGAGQIAYAYGANNNLTQVTYPDTRTRRYSYNYVGVGQLNLLTGLEDEATILYASWTYGAKNVVTGSVHAGNVDNYTFTYNADGSRVIVDPRGTSRTYTSQLIAGQTLHRRERSVPRLRRVRVRDVRCIRQLPEQGRFQRRADDLRV